MDTPSAVLVRPAVVADLEALLRLDQALVAYDAGFDPTLDRRWTLSEEGVQFFMDRITGEEGCAFAAEADGQLVGYLVGALVAAETYRTVRRAAELECLYVDGSCRGRGTGEELVRRFEAWAAGQGAERLTVTVSAANEGALRFYRRSGFADYDRVLEKPLAGGSA